MKTIVFSIFLIGLVPSINLLAITLDVKAANYYDCQNKTEYEVNVKLGSVLKSKSKLVYSPENSKICVVGSAAKIIFDAAAKTQIQNNGRLRLYDNASLINNGDLTVSGALDLRDNSRFRVMQGAKVKIQSGQVVGWGFIGGDVTFAENSTSNLLGQVDMYKGGDLSVHKNAKFDVFPNSKLSMSFLTYGNVQDAKHEPWVMEKAVLDCHGTFEMLPFSTLSISNGATATINEGSTLQLKSRADLSVSGQLQINGSYVQISGKVSVHRGSSLKIASTQVILKHTIYMFSGSLTIASGDYVEIPYTGISIEKGAKCETKIPPAGKLADEDDKFLVIEPGFENDWFKCQ